jgi:molybdopterin molybdotransferase
MITVEEALERILACANPLDTETVSIQESLGRFLAEPAVAGDDVPPFDNSAMDGYALRAADVARASRSEPVSLRVLATLPAGEASRWSVAPGTAVRIMTGAPIPPGADAVVRFEDTDEAAGQARMSGDVHPGRVQVFCPALEGENIRRAGEDVHRGEAVLAPGTRLRPADVGALAMLGIARVQVYRRPKVAVLATGDELVPLGEPLGPGKIRNSNEFSVSALVETYGAVPIRLGIARDTVEDLTAHLEMGFARGADLFVTSAGVSVGQFDVVKDVLSSLGQIEFWQVRMKPGKPLAFGNLRGVPLIGLPGNPVSAMVSFEQFARPAILKMQGSTRLRKPVVDVIADHNIKGGDRREFKRAIVEWREGRYHARLTGEQGSGILTSMVKANALVIVREGTCLVMAGESVPAQMLEWPEVA